MSWYTPPANATALFSGVGRGDQMNDGDDIVRNGYAHSLDHNRPAIASLEALHAPCNRCDSRIAIECHAPLRAATRYDEQQYMTFHLDRHTDAKVVATADSDTCISQFITRQNVFSEVRRMQSHVSMSQAIRMANLACRCSFFMQPH